MYAYVLRGWDDKGHVLVTRRFPTSRGAERAAEELYECGHVWNVTVAYEVWEVQA